MNKIIFVLLLMTVMVFMTSCKLHRNVNQLQLVKVYDVITRNDLVTQNNLEPSGLTLWDGEFYTVSDKHHKIYQLVFNQNKVILKPIIDIYHRDNINLDFEGITHDNEFFYLISEKSFQILRISKDGKFQKWFPMTSHIYDAGKKAGLFQTHNANIEGICSLGGDKFLLAAECQPRGFVEYNANTQEIKAYQKNQAVFEYENGRSPDFTGLSCTDGMYVLDRNAYMVAQLKRIGGEYVETKGYSYAHIINQANLKYQDMEFGHAEGLVVKGNKVYIILDNNKNPHSNSSNNDSLFVEMRKK